MQHDCLPDPDDRAAEIAALRARIKARDAENARLRERIAALEHELAACREQLLPEIVQVPIDVATQRATEQALRESEARFAAAFEGSPIALVISTVADGRILDANERFLTLFGRSRAELIGQPTTAIGMWDSLPDREHVLALFQHEGRVRDHELVIQAVGGRRHVLLSIEPLAIAETPCLLTALYDITDRVEAVAALKASELHLRTVIEHAGMSIWAVDAEQRLTMANTAFLAGARANMGGTLELGQRMPPAWLPEPLRADFEARYQRVLAGETVQDEWVTETIAGELYAWENIFNPIMDAEQRIVGATCFGRNSTQRKLQEEQLRQSEERLRLFLAHAPAAVAMLDRDMRYLAVSLRWLQDYGIAGDILGRSHYEVFPDIPERWKAIHQRCLAGAVERAEEDCFARADGTCDWLSWEVRPWYDTSGTIGGIIVFSEDITLRKATETALRESEARYRAIVRNLPGGSVIIVDHDLRCLLAEGPLLALLGLSWEQMQQRTPAEVLDPQLTEVVETRFRRALAGEEFTLEVTSAERTFWTHYTPLRDDEQIWAAMTLTFDITARTAAEAALQRSEARYRAIARSLPDAAVLVVGHDLRYLVVEGPLLTLLGLSREQLEGHTPHEALDAETARRATAHFTEALTGQDTTVEYSYGGHVLWTRYTPLRDGGQVIGALALALDITTQKQAEAALRRSEALYRAIASSLPDAAVLIVDHDLRYLVAEGPLLALLGYSRERMEGRTPAEVFDAAVAETVAARFRRALAGEDVVTERSFAENMVWSHYAPLRDEDGRIWAAIAFTLDVTQRTRLEEQLRQAQKMESIGQLAGGIAHDFNNLLTAIGGYADLALASLPPQSPISADLDEIQRAAERASALTRQLLAFARRQRMEMRPLSLNTLVSNMEKLLRRLIGEHIQLVVNLTPNLSEVVADAGQLEQVLVNLAVNARDAMPDGGTLIVSTENVALDPRYAHGHIDLPAGAYVLLAVSDTGVGIPPEHQPHLFEPFFTTKPVGKGTGLGLATCYGIVKQHGGTIWVYSELGHGTVVKVYLPHGNAGKAGELPENRPTTLPRGTETVLLAEDEPAVRALAARVLRGCGYTVLTAADGEEALRVAQAHAPEPIHLLLTDVVMPRLGGVAAAAQLRAQIPALRVLFMSGYTGLSTAQEDAAIMDAPLLQKPFMPMALATAVRAALDALRYREDDQA